MADSPKEPKADLKSRLGLKSRSAAPPAAPIVPGAPPPEPPKPKVEKPTAETIEEARRKAAEAEKEAGPAIEQFQLAAPEQTPLPSALPAAPRVEYVEIKAEETPETIKKRRMMLIIVGVSAALIFFVIGRMMGSSSARSDLNESVLLEAQEKQKLLEGKQVTFDQIAVIRAQLDKIDSAVRLLDPEQGDITTLEKDFADLVEVMVKFANNKQSSLDPIEVIGNNVVNGDLMRELALFSFQTKSFHEAVSAAVDEAQAMLAANPIPPPDRQKLLAIAEPDALEVEGLGKVPLSKGTLVVQAGRPEGIQTRDAAGNPVTEFYQKVRVEGREEPVQIKTTQMVQVDMAPWWDKTAKQTKRTVLTRLAMIAAGLHEQVKKLDPKPVRAAIQEVLDRGSM